MNIFISGAHDIKCDAYDEMLEELDTNYCAYTTTDINAKRHLFKTIEYEPIYLYASYDYFLEKRNNMIPLDAELLRKMAPYEKTTMDIIFRWRRSISAHEGYKDIKSIYKNYLRYWNDFILSNDINLIIQYNTPHIPMNFILYALSKVHSIPIVLSVRIAQFNDGLRREYLTSELYDMDEIFLNYYSQLQADYYNSREMDIQLNSVYQKYFDEYDKDNEDIKRIITSNTKMRVADKLKLVRTRSKLYLKQKKYKLLFNKFKYLIKMKYKSAVILNYAESLEVAPNLNDEFIFYPLHLQPECTTLPQAGYYEDQLLVIQMLSKYIPKGAFLYVKEHPAYWQIKERYECVSESRSKDFYNELTSLKNVKFIKHDYSSLSLIDACVAVATCTGTVSLETVFKNKNVLMFGYNCYRYMPGVQMINKKEDCEKAIKDIFRKKNDTITDKELRIFFKALEKMSYVAGTYGSFNGAEHSPLTLDSSSKRIKDALLRYIKIRYPFFFK